MTTNWNKVTEVLPIEGREYLVWTGQHMFVSTAEFFGELPPEYDSLKEARKELKGCFPEFGSKCYFNDDNVYWSELPLAPGVEEPKLEEPQFDSLDIYLKKDDQIVGLHAIGHKEPDGAFYSLEQWGNEYDDEHNMLGRGSFRVHNDIETVAKDFEADGWVRFEGPKKKTKDGV